MGTIVHDADALVDHRRYHTATDVIVRERKRRSRTIVHDADAVVASITGRRHTAADVIVRRRSRTMPMREAVASIRGGAIRQPMS